MAIPDFQTIMLPLLTFAGDGQEHFMLDAVTYIAKKFELTDEERNEMLPSGQQRRLDNRVGWSRSHLTKAGLLETTKTSHFRITSEGLKVLQAQPPKIDVIFLDKYAGHLEFRKGPTKGPKPPEPGGEQSPKETIENSYQKLREDLAQEILATIKKQSPAFFERLVVTLLVAMGYGGSIADAGQAVGKSGDGGIDGIIKEDKLGLDVIYIQAKRWAQGTVGRPDIQGFVGALEGRTNKGVFITTSDFTTEARNYARSLNSKKVVLLDGGELAQLMIDYNIGVTRDAVYEIKRVDADFFTEA